MIKLKRLLETFDPFVAEDLESNSKIKSYLDESGVSYRIEEMNGVKFFIVDFDEKYITWINDTGYAVVEKISEFIYRVNEEMEFYNLTGIDYREYYTNQFWGNVGRLVEYNDLFHATEEERVPKILKEGLKPERETFMPGKLTHFKGVFAVKNWQLLEKGTYGDAILEIDTEGMKENGFTPQVGRESDFEEQHRLRIVKEKLNLDIDPEKYFHHRSAGTWRDTVVILSHIPAKYISEFRNK